MRSVRAGLLVLVLASLAGCGGEVANSTTTSGNGQGSASPQASSSPANTSRCNPNGIDSSVTDRGPADDFNEGANVAGSTSASGLTSVDLKQGTGAAVQSGQCITVQYTGWLTNGTKFDSSRDRVGAFQFVIGAGNVIPGWDQGILGMRVGGRRRLTIPPALGYGAQGQGQIPPNATLVFDVELLRIVGQ